MPADGPLARLTVYELRHLISHLIATGRAVDLHWLLELELADGRNAWFEAKGAGGRTGEYAADLAAAWQLARTTRDIPRQLRYALMSASVRSHWRFVPARLLRACVGAGLVPWQGALSIIEQMLSSRSKAIGELAPVIPEEELSFLLDQALAREGSQDDVVKELAPCLPLALVRRVLPAVRDDAAVSELIFRLAELGEVTEALDLFTRYRSVPLALRLASLVDDQERLFGDDAFLVAVLNSGGADAVEPTRLGAWAERVVNGPVDERTAQALLASFARLPRPARGLIDPLLRCAASGDLGKEVSALADLAPALDERARRAALRRAVTLTLNAPVRERTRIPEFGDDPVLDVPVRADLCEIVAPVLADYGYRRAALRLARLAWQDRSFTYPDWPGALVEFADGVGLGWVVSRVAATRDPGMRLYRILTILPFVADRHRSRLLSRVRREIAKLEDEAVLVDFVRWLPPQEREDALTAALQSGSFFKTGPLLERFLKTGPLLEEDSPDFPGLVDSLPPQARRRFLDRVVAAARNLKPADAAATLLAVARSSEPDRRPALLLEAARLYRDGLLDSEHGRPGGWLPFTAEEIGQLDLREVLGYYQAAADEREIGDYQDRLLRECYAQAGDLKTVRTYGPLTASLLRLAIPAASSSELLQGVAGLSADDRVQACIDLAREGPLDILGDVVEIARSFGDVAARGEVLLSAAERVPDRAEAVRLRQEAREPAVESGPIPEKHGGISIPASQFVVIGRTTSGSSKANVQPVGEIARRLCRLGKPDQAIALLREVPDCRMRGLVATSTRARTSPSHSPRSGQPKSSASW